MRRVFIVGVLAVIGCHLPADPTADPSATPVALTKQDDYTPWPSVTSEPYVVDVEFFSWCRGPTPAEVDAHERKHGPHGVHAINVRVSPIGRDEFLTREPVPVGTVVVKEKLTGGKVVAVGTMTKKEPGYDPDNGDWEYTYRELKADAPPPTVGKIESCIICHRLAAGKDYLFRPYLNRVR